MILRNAEDGRVHFSDLVQLAQSPAHYKLSVETRRDVTRPMVVGSVSDDLIFHNGRNVARYPGKVRNGKEWEAFRAANESKVICIGSEFEDARGAAEAVLNDARAMEILSGCEFQRVMQWQAYELPCAAGLTGKRGGFDALHLERGYVADLKITGEATEPEQLQRHAMRRHWDAQLAWYIDGAQALGMGTVRDGYLICAEATPPHNVTVLRASPQVLEFGRKKLYRWTEDLRKCEVTGRWPGYTQAIVEWALPEWALEDTSE